MASKLRTDVGADYTAYDSGDLGCRRNHERVWQHLATLDKPWSLVLEDDAQPVDDFRTQLERALAVAPADIISLYLGTGYPTYWQEPIRRALAKRDTTDAHWLIGKHLINGVAVVMRTELIHPMISHITRYPNSPMDESISAWASRTDHPIAHCIPSLVDHADVPTVHQRHADGLKRHLPRKAWLYGTRDEWSNTATQLKF